jgi:hypothetical protein
VRKIRRRVTPKVVETAAKIRTSAHTQNGTQITEFVVTQPILLLISTRFTYENNGAEIEPGLRH